MGQTQVVLAVLYCVVIAFNVTGNSLVIHIISRKQRSATEYLLLNLAVADLTFGISCAAYILILMFGDIDPFSGKTFMNIIYITNGCLVWFSQMSSVFTMIALSVERYFAVCRPHNFRRCFSKRNVKMVLVASWILWLVLVVPLGIRPKETFVVYSMVIMINGVITLLFLIVLSIKIYLSLWCKHTVIQPTALREIEETKKKKKVTACVLGVIFTFAICYIPFLVVNILRNYALENQNLVGRLYNATALGLLINAALDPYLFSFQNSRFRVLLKKMVLCKIKTSTEETQP